MTTTPAATVATEDIPDAVSDARHRARRTANRQQEAPMSKQRTTDRVKLPDGQTGTIVGPPARGEIAVQTDGGLIEVVPVADIRPAPAR